MENSSSQNFQNTVFPLGNIKEGVSYHAVFMKQPNAKRISKMGAPCGCTIPDESGSSINVSYTSGPIAPELLEMGQTSINVSKTVSIEYEDKTSETLTITATIHH